MVFTLAGSVVIVSASARKLHRPRYIRFEFQRKRFQQNGRASRTSSRNGLRLLWRPPRLYASENGQLYATQENTNFICYGETTASRGTKEPRGDITEEENTWRLAAADARKEGG